MTRITRIAWTVPSATDPDVLYTVSAPSWDAPLTCDCTASAYPKTRGRCWHIKAVASGLAGKPRVGATVTPTLSRVAVAA